MRPSNMSTRWFRVGCRLLMASPRSGTIVKPAVCPNPPRKTLPNRSINFLDVPPTRAAEDTYNLSCTEHRYLVDLVEEELLFIAQGRETTLQSLRSLLLHQERDALVRILLFLRRNRLDSNLQETVSSEHACLRKDVVHGNRQRSLPKNELSDLRIISQILRRQTC